MHNWKITSVHVHSTARFADVTFTHINDRATQAIQIRVKDVTLQDGLSTLYYKARAKLARSLGKSPQP